MTASPFSDNSLGIHNIPSIANKFIVARTFVTLEENSILIHQLDYQHRPSTAHEYDIYTGLLGFMYCFSAIADYFFTYRKYRNNIS